MEFDERNPAEKSHLRLSFEEQNCFAQTWIAMRCTFTDFNEKETVCDYDPKLKNKTKHSLVMVSSIY